MFINRRGPSPGKGWGCLVCGLPQDGAVAVLCDGCAVAMQGSATWYPRYVCAGYAKDGGRVPFDQLSREVFEHDDSRHEPGDYYADLWDDGGAGE